LQVDAIARKHVATLDEDHGNIKAARFYRRVKKIDCVELTEMIVCAISQ
jgi:hypothetical protein